MRHPRHWPVIRNIRALKVLAGVAYKAVFVWHIYTGEELDNSGFYRQEIQKAKDILAGLQ